MVLRRRQCGQVVVIHRMGDILGGAKVEGDCEEEWRQDAGENSFGMPAISLKRKWGQLLGYAALYHVVARGGKRKREVR